MTPYYQDDAVTIYHGDCREIVPTLGRFDAVVTSPPYNCGKEYGECADLLPIDEYVKFLKATVFAIPARIVVCNVGQYIGSREERISMREIIARAATAWKLVDEVIWDKGPANGAAWGNYPNSPRIRAQHESIYIYGDAKMRFGNGLEWGEWSRLTTSIWRVPAQVDLSIHPAMMPYEIAHRCVALWSDVEGTVLDPFMGSGTTIVASKRLGRRGVGIELNEQYCEIAARRCGSMQRVSVEDEPLLALMQAPPAPDAAEVPR